MKDVQFTVKENKALAENVCKMTLEGDASEITKPGQFINISLPGFYLRRPISVCDKTGNTVTIIYKVVGRGTELMKNMLPGEGLCALTGLGNGYDISPAGASPLLAGGGAGVPPLYYLAKELKKSGISPTVVLGFNTKDEVFCEEEFRALGCAVTVATADGSYGVKGFVTDAFPAEYSYVYACGPKPMLRAVYLKPGNGQFSFEERMGCGFGACMGCSQKTKTGYKRVCREGPVFYKEEIVWED